MAKKGRSSSFRVTQAHADVLYWAVPVAAAASGLLSSAPALWFGGLARLAAGLCAGQLVLAALWEVASFHLAAPRGQRLQHRKSAPPLYAQEAVGSTLCMFVVACLAAWPYLRYQQGLPIAFKATLAEAVPEAARPYAPLFYLAQMAAMVLGADAWTFWKHYSLHSPRLYAVHKSHHAFHNPSTFAGFAIHPLEALWTFAPILLMGAPALGLYAPVHGPFLASFAALNLYLHCGYAIPLLEWALPRLWVNTSVWHNKHHELSVAHFGEMLTLWDYALGTHTGGWDAARVAQQAAAVEVGKSGMDEAAAPDAAAAAADAVCTACDAENTVPNRVFWDAACHACYAEISMIQKLGEKQDLEFVDISAPDFDARKDQYIDGATTPYAVEMIGEFDGVQTVGVETFRRMYAQIFPRVGTPIASVSRLPGIAHAAEAGYWMFAHLIRPNLPKRRVAVCTAACDAKKQKQT